jgi:hypothetical protein
METTEFDDKILDFNDDTNLDVKIKPNFYIHNALLMAQRTLMFATAKGTVSEGLLTYSIFIEQLEVLCRAADYLEENYEKSINDFRESKEYKDQKREEVKMAKLANKKLELIMKSVFELSPTQFPMKYGSAKKKEEKDEKKT